MRYTILSAQQSSLLENLVVKYGQIVTFENIFSQAQSQWDYKQTKNLLTKLVKNGWLIRIKRGLYAISEMSTRGFLSVSPYRVANLLVQDSYVSFESALHYHGMFDQLTKGVKSVSLKAYHTTALQGIEYRFVKTKPEYYFGWQEAAVENSTVRIATVEKALIDMVNFHKSKYTIDVVIEKIRDHKRDIDIVQLTHDLAPFSIATIKTFGFTLDLLGRDSSALLKLAHEKRGTHRMFAGDKKFNAKWRLYYDSYFDRYQSTTH